MIAQKFISVRKRTRRSSRRLVPADVMNSAHSYIELKNEYECYSQFGFGGARLGGVAGELSPAGVYVSFRRRVRRQNEIRVLRAIC